MLCGVRGPCSSSSPNCIIEHQKEARLGGIKGELCVVLLSRGSRSIRDVINTFFFFFYDIDTLFSIVHQHTSPTHQARPFYFILSFLLCDVIRNKQKKKYFIEYNLLYNKILFYRCVTRVDVVRVAAGGRAI